MRLHRALPLRTRPTVSVVVPCYNYGHFLPDCIGGILDQPGVDVEVIVVDDCSTDDSLAVAHRLAALDTRVTVVEHPVNQGHIRTYNDGLARCRGDHVVLLSADDVLAPGSLARSAALLEYDPELALVYGFPETFTDAPEPGPTRVTHWTVWEGEEWLRRVCDRGRNIIVNPEAMMRRSVMDALGGYRVDHPHAADLQVWMRAALRGRVGRVNGPVQAYYRVHDSNMHSTRFAGVLTDLRESKRVFDEFWDEVDATTTGDTRVRRVSDLTDLQHRAGRAMASEALLLAGVAQAAGGTTADASAGELAAFALECAPDIRTTRRWHLYERRERRGLARGEAAAVTAAWSLRWKLRWRRWRRFGT